MFHGRVAGAHVQGFGPKASAPGGLLQVLNIRLRPRPLSRGDTMKRANKHPFTTWASAAALSITLAGCNQHGTGDVGNNASATAAPIAEPSAPPTPTASIPSPAGPEMLSTVGLYEGTPLTSAKARAGTYALEKIDGFDTLTLNGKPTRYTPAGADGPVPVAANDSITLVGVFELPQESVAWVIISGGSACAGTHVLVGARNGLALPGQGIPGCDDRGTMRRNGDKITFEAGGSAGSYQDGLITVTSKPSGY